MSITLEKIKILLIKATFVFIWRTSPHGSVHKNIKKVLSSSLQIALILKYIDWIKNIIFVLWTVENFNYLDMYLMNSLKKNRKSLKVSFTVFDNIYETQARKIPNSPNTECLVFCFEFSEMMYLSERNQTWRSLPK